MEKLPLPMCRVCLAGNVRMYVVVNNNLHELYEKLTDNPFVTEDKRPILACYFCCTKLKQCYQFQRQCLEAEERFAQMMNEDYKRFPLKYQVLPEFGNGLIRSPMELISVVGVCQPENITIKEELPAVCEILDDVTEPKKEQSDGLELEDQENRFSDVKDNILEHHSESDSEDDTLMEFKIDVQEHEVSRNKQRGSDAQRTPSAKILKLHSRRTKPEDMITEEQKENKQSDTTVIHNHQKCTFTTVTKFKDPLPYTTPRLTNRNLDVNCRNDSSNENSKRKTSSKDIDIYDINRHPGLCVQEKLFKCDTCERFFISESTLTCHIKKHAKKPHKCAIYPHSFIQRSHLKDHIRTHTGENPYKCDICKRFFSNESKLTCHISKHGKKPHKCDICQRNFLQKGSLVSHMRTHTGEKPYKCDICQRRFIIKGSFTNHIRTHTGEKPYK